MLTERPPVTDTINTDADSPALRAALAELCGMMAGQLARVSGDLSGSKMTIWQAVKIASMLSRVVDDVAALRREASRLVTNTTEDV